MNSITELVLIESRSARTSHLSNLSDERALETLNKAKALVMAVWQSTEIATTAQLAEFYEVGIDALKSILRRNKEEFEQDGVKVLEKDDLKFDSVNLTLSSRTNRLTVWTPKAALRLGMVLQDSPVAKQVRSVILDVVEAAGPAPKLKTLEDLTPVQLVCLKYHCERLELGLPSDSLLLEGIDPIFWNIPRIVVDCLIAKHKAQTSERLMQTRLEIYLQHTLQNDHDDRERGLARVGSIAFFSQNQIDQLVDLRAEASRQDRIDACSKFAIDIYQQQLASIK